MATFTVKADVVVQVEIEINADTLDQARKLFDENIALNATLVDMDEDDFIVCDDCIIEVENLRIHETEEVDY